MTSLLLFKGLKTIKKNMVGFLVFALIVLISCGTYQRESTAENHFDDDASWIEIGFPDSLTTYGIEGDAFNVISRTNSKDSQKFTSPSVILYLFDGSCSGCIAEFILWNNNWINQLDNELVLMCYVIRTNNSASFEYYLEELNVQLPKNYIALLDIDGDATRELLRPLEEDLSCKVILISNREKKIVCGDPFSNGDLLTLFKKMIEP